MLNFKEIRNKKTGEVRIKTSLTGKPLLTTPQLNKGTAFTTEERHTFGLIGKLPMQVETLDEQVKRAYQQFRSYRTKLKQHIYLNDLHDKNQTLFYKLVSQHIREMMPLIYTPTVGVAVKKFSRDFRQPRGLYIAYPEMDHIEEILENRSNPDVELIVITDGEGILGIGDQGIGGMDIPVAKLMVYTLCGGVNPLHTLPILLDMGTNNKTLLRDPLYLGWRHPRIHGAQYDEFMDRFIQAVRTRFPKVFLHWEDFGRANAQRYLHRFKDKVCTFNDDIQGTGIVTLSALMAACRATNTHLEDQRIVIFGAGTAGAGIAEQIHTALQREGLSQDEAYQRFWLIDRSGLLLKNSPDLTAAQQHFARAPSDVQHWSTSPGQTIDLGTVIRHVKPTALIGASAVPQAFTYEVISEMAKHVEQPIVFPLSNPTERMEITPQQFIEWTGGKGLIATGSPSDDVLYGGRIFHVAQCNNALVFPGIGLGVIAVKARQLTEGMIQAACEALSRHAPILKDPSAPLLPSLAEARPVAKEIALAVASQAVQDGVATENLEASFEETIENIFWEPHYLPYEYDDQI